MQPGPMDPPQTTAGSDASAHGGNEDQADEIRQRIGAVWRRNPQQEVVLQTFGEKAAAMQWLHLQSAHHYRSVNAWFVYVSLLFNTLAGVGGFGGASLLSGQDASALAYVVGTVNIVNALVMSIMRTVQAAEKAEAHSRRSAGYATLYRTIALEMGLTPDHRCEMHSFAHRCRADFDRLQLNTPPVPRKVVRDFLARYPDQRNKPDIAVGVATVTIYRDVESAWPASPPRSPRASETPPRAPELVLMPRA